MPQSFGDQLKLFALSIDVVDNERFNSIGDMINDYCEKVLQIQHTRVFLESTVEGSPGLKRFLLGRQEHDGSRRIRNDHGEYNGQSCFAFDKARPMWIVSESKGALAEYMDYIDLWKCTDNIPAYRKIQEDEDDDNSKMKTSILLPIQSGQKKIGVVNFETTEYLEITSEAKSELTKIAETIYILRSLLLGSQGQRQNTDSAMKQLLDNLTKPQPKLTKPRVFLASSARAKSDVITTIKKTLEKYKDSIDLDYWKENKAPGNINEQLLNTIAACRYGVCYFSEEHAENGYSFKDNPNVLFEAGMFHGRADEMAPYPNSWIPVREKNSPDIPFDFAQERIIWVERDNDGVLNQDKLEQEFNDALSSLIINQNRMNTR